MEENQATIVSLCLLVIDNGEHKMLADLKVEKIEIIELEGSPYSLIDFYLELPEPKSIGQQPLFFRLEYPKNNAIIYCKKHWPKADIHFLSKS